MNWEQKMKAHVIRIEDGWISGLSWRFQWRTHLDLASVCPEVIELAYVGLA